MNFRARIKKKEVVEYMSFVFHSLWTVSSGRERQYSGSRIACKTENKRELYEFFVHVEIFAMDYNLTIQRLSLLSSVVCCSKFNSVFLSQMKSDWADFWICYSSNKT